MKDDQVLRKFTYSHLVLKGTSYEVGYQLGEFYKSKSELIHTLTAPFYGSTRNDQKQADKIMELFDQYCPNLNEEIKGFADCVNVKSQDIILYYSFLGKEEFHCSHFAILPSKSDNLLMARNYEYCWGEEPLLLTTHIQGQAAQIGFAAYLFGRFDGMNEYGLCVSTSSCNVSYSLDIKGFAFIGVVRALLNKFRNVEEAINYLMSVPIGEGRSYMISDQSGKAALVEMAGENKSYSIISNKSERNYLCSANHFILPKTCDLNSNITWHSQKCFDTLDRTLKNAGWDFGKVKIKELLSKPIPEGSCSQHYIEGFGTMWSIIFEPQKGVASICFGSPQYGEWHEFSVDTPKVGREYEVRLINEVSNPEFWSMYDSDILDALLKDFMKEKDITAIILDYGYVPDEVWIDEGIHLTLIVVSMKKYKKHYYLDYEGITVTVHVMEREELKKINDASVSSFQTGYHGVLLFSRDETLEHYYKKRFSNREYDREIILIREAVHAVESLRNANISMLRFHDYSQSFVHIIELVKHLAEIEVNLNKEIPVRASLHQAFIYNPDLFKTIYTDMIYNQNNELSIKNALEKAEEYLEERAEILFYPILEYLSEKGTFIKASDLNEEIGRRYGFVRSLQSIFEWLEQKNIILRGSTTIKLAYGSKSTFEEVAYFYERGDSN